MNFGTPKITLKSEHGNETVTHEAEIITLEEMLSQFQYFLKGCGFHFSGELEFVNSDNEIEVVTSNEDNSHFTSDKAREAATKNEADKLCESAEEALAVIKKHALLGFHNCDVNIVAAEYHNISTELRHLGYRVSDIMGSMKIIEVSWGI